MTSSITAADIDPSPPVQLAELFKRATELGASDIHVVPGHHPAIRVHTELTPQEDMAVVTPDDAERLVREMISEERYATLQEKRDLDFSTKLEGHSRYRVNAHYERERLAISFRQISPDIPPYEKLNLPPVIRNFCNMPRGLVLVTGPTGSGKSTSLAAVINLINHTHAHHIITLEDPIEYEMFSARSLIEQREVGADVASFASGLRHALRQDPDVILVGEMRDLETTSAAITAAETGHLVFSTLHTQSASQTLERIIDIYPGEQQSQIRSMLANTLQAVVTQTLLKRIDKPGMLPACEIMICNSAVRNCIRENRIHEIPGIIETSRSQGMCLLDDSLRALAINGHISPEQAVARAANPQALARLLNS